MSTTEVKHPEVEVRLTGHDGNAFAVLATVTRALKDAGVAQAEIDEYFGEATAGNFDQLLETTMRWVEVS
jgi:hypothetical protein